MLLLRMALVSDREEPLEDLYKCAMEYLDPCPGAFRPVACFGCARSSLMRGFRPGLPGSSSRRALRIVHAGAPFGFA